MNLAEAIANAVMEGAVPTFTYVLVVIRYESRFVLIQECDGFDWYFPAGHVEPGESLCAAARREAAEESGVSDFVIDGLMDFRLESGSGFARQHFVFAASLAELDERMLKDVADEESLQAGLFDRREIEALPLRGPEVIEYVDAVLAGHPVLPISECH